MEQGLPYFGAMTFIDLAIIYLACGAPLSMHYFFASNSKATLRFAAKVISVALVWPVSAFFLIKSVRKPASGLTSTKHSETEQKLDILRLELEDAAFSDETASLVFEFRELYARYTGLAQARSRDSVQYSSHELFLLSGHTNSELASRCIARKASNHLSIHADAAREEFVDSIAALSIAAKTGLIQTAASVADLVDDEQAIAMLYEFSNDPNDRPALTEKRDLPKTSHVALS